LVLLQRGELGVQRATKGLKRRRKASLSGFGQSCRELYGKAWEVTERILERLDVEVRTAGASLLVFTFPTAGQLDVREARLAKSCTGCPCSGEPPANQIAAICERLGIDFLDLYPLISQPENNGTVLYSRSDLHWNAAGHALAAEAVARALADLPRPTPPGQEQGSRRVAHATPIEPDPQ
jgi:hypothetical protein